MRRKILASLTALLLLWAVSYVLSAKDRCLDQGGSWDDDRCARDH